MILAFISGLAWSGLDIARKSLGRDLGSPIIATGLSLGLASLFGVAALISGPTLQPADYVWPAALSIVLCTAVQVLIVESVRRSELSRTIPLLSFTPVATSLFGLAVLGEEPSPVQWAGIGLVFAGALGLGFSRRQHEPDRPPPRFKLDSGVLLMLLAAICISAAAPFDKLAIEASSTPVHGFFQSAGASVLLLLFLVLRGDLARIRRLFQAPVRMTLAILLAFAAVGLQFAAYRYAMVGEVETIKRVVGLVASLAAGSLIFGESINARKLITVVAMGIGVALMLR